MDPQKGSGFDRKEVAKDSLSVAFRLAQAQLACIKESEVENTGWAQTGPAPWAGT